MSHYKKEDLELFRSGEMSLLGRISCSRHLAECKKCARSLQELEQDDSLLNQLKNSIRLYKEFSDSQNHITKRSV